MAPEQFETAFRTWVQHLMPNLAPRSWRSMAKPVAVRPRRARPPLHLVSAFAAEAGVLLGQQATAAKSNEKTAIPELLASLALEGCTVTIDAMGTQPSIAKAIRDQGADYVLAVKDNQPQLREAIDDFFEQFRGAAAGKTPHDFAEELDKGHGRLEVRRCYAFESQQCLPNPARWPDLESFCIIESQRDVKGKVAQERRLYISSLPADARRLGSAVRQHWKVENQLHWCLGVSFADDQMRARTAHAAHNLAILKRLTLNLIRLDPVERKGSLKVKRLIAASSDDYRAHLIGIK